MNCVHLIGRLTATPELKTSSNGTHYVSFSVAVSERYNGKDSVDYIRCTAFGKTADTIANYTEKGSQIGLEGRLRQNNYTSSNGMKINSLEVLVNKVDLIGGRSTSQNRGTNAGPNADAQSQQNNFSNPYYGNSSYGQQGSAPYSPLNGYTHQVPDPEEQPDFPIDSSDLPF